MTRYEKEYERVTREAAAERDKARLETAKLEAEILDQAKTAVQRLEQEGREQIEREVAKLRSELQEQSRTMAREIASKVLGREVAS